MNANAGEKSVLCFMAAFSEKAHGGNWGLKTCTCAHVRASRFCSRKHFGKNRQRADGEVAGFEHWNCKIKSEVCALPRGVEMEAFWWVLSVCVCTDAIWLDTHRAGNRKQRNQKALWTLVCLFP